MAIEVFELRRFLRASLAAAVGAAAGATLVGLFDQALWASATGALSGAGLGLLLAGPPPAAVGKPMAVTAPSDGAGAGFAARHGVLVLGLAVTAWALLAVDARASLPLTAAGASFMIAAAARGGWVARVSAGATALLSVYLGHKIAQHVGATGHEDLADVWTGGLVASATVLAVLPRHLRWVARGVTRPGLVAGDPDLTDLCTRAEALRAGLQERKSSDPHGQLLRDGIDRVHVAAGRIPTAAAVSDAVDARIEAMTVRISACVDAEARAQFAAARDALIEQRAALRETGHYRERMIARLHHHVATLERFVALEARLVGHRELDAGATRQVAEASAEIAASCEAIRELTREDAGGPEAVVAAVVDAGAVATQPA